MTVDTEKPSAHPPLAQLTDLEFTPGLETHDQEVERPQPYVHPRSAEVLYSWSRRPCG